MIVQSYAQLIVTQGSQVYNTYKTETKPPIQYEGKTTIQHSSGSSSANSVSTGKERKLSFNILGVRPSTGYVEEATY
jgi:hypothetical protein